MTTSQSSLRRSILALTIGSFSIAALMGVLALVAGGGFGEGEVKVLLTTLVVGCASVCVLCYLATADTPYRVVGAVGGVVVLLPVLTGLTQVWSDWDGPGPSEVVLKWFGVGTVLALTLAQACMLLGVAWASRSVRWLLWSTLFLAAALAALISRMILFGGWAEGTWRLLGVIAILDVLGTVVTVAMARFGSKADSGRAPAPRPAGREVFLSGRLVERVARRAEAEGRSAEAVIAEAVERYLAADRDASTQ